MNKINKFNQIHLKVNKNLKILKKIADFIVYFVLNFGSKHYLLQIINISFVLLFIIKTKLYFKFNITLSNLIF
jgi:hypothetical protein